MARLSWWGSRALASCLFAGYLLPLASAYNLDPDSADSVKSTASDMAEDMLTFYNGNKPGGTPGLLTLPYYWWYGGAMFGALIDYWYYTGDTRWNNMTTEGMLNQVGAYNDFMPDTQTLTEGNDDQGFWGLAAMQAAEYNFPNPPADKPQWLALAQAVFNTQASRWDTSTCGGGLRWQIFTWNKGYTYKNSISLACFFSLAARLALYTGNTTYSEWAERSWAWMVDVKFIDTDTYYIIDGADISTNCTEHVPYLFTYNAGGFLAGAAAMYNLTGSDTWKERVDGLVRGIDVFFPGGSSDNSTNSTNADSDNGNVMMEVACEPVNNCNADAESFKAYLSRWLTVATKWAPHISTTVQPKLRASAVAAARQCTGGSNGRMCGLKWANNSGEWDGTTGLGHQMAALEVVLSQLAGGVGTPLTSGTGATSVGDPSAGSQNSGNDRYTGAMTEAPLPTSQAAGAAVLTVALVLGLLVGVVFMFVDETTAKTMPERWADFRSEVSAMKRAVASAGAVVVTAVLCGRRRRQITTHESQQQQQQQQHTHETPTESSEKGAVLGRNKLSKSKGRDALVPELLISEPTRSHEDDDVMMMTATRASAVRPAAARTRLPPPPPPSSSSSSLSSNHFSVSPVSRASSSAVHPTRTPRVPTGALLTYSTSSSSSSSSSKSSPNPFSDRYEPRGDGETGSIGVATTTEQAMPSTTRGMSMDQARPVPPARPARAARYPSAGAN